jgi:hypothetical protein
MARLVTGYVRLNSGHRPHARYLELGRRLVGLGLPTLAFYDGDPRDLAPTPATEVRGASLRSCWLYEASRGALPPGGTPQKDSVDYCVVQHQKTAWLAEAARLTGDHVIWIDFGIFHLRAPITDRMVKAFVDQVEAAPPDRIAVPAVWPMVGRPLIDWTNPAWYVAGGVLVMPPEQADWFHEATSNVATLQLEASKRVTWEVNTWSAILRDYPERFRTYAADHDQRIFTGYGRGGG